MEGKSTLQSSERSERGLSRRPSSILKATHSPLKDATSVNEPAQEQTMEKRQRSSRRVSFAETIRVFSLELQATGSDDKENAGYENGNSSNNISKGAAAKCAIAGMDTLLHGPIQAPAHNSDWNYVECAKDRAIVFSSDNDMDMTASNTVTIHGMTQEGTKKMDAKQFLSSLKSQNSKEAKMQDFPLCDGGEKHFDFKRDSSMENKMNFSGFLAGLGGEKSKATGLYDNDQTVLFSCDQQDMDLTRSHTVSIDSKVLSKILPNTNILKQKFHEFNSKHNENHLENTLVSGDLQEKTFLYEQNDMDITRSHTTAIENKILEGVKAKNVTTEFQSTKRKSILDLTTNTVTSGICFESEDMDTTKSNTGFFSAEARRAPCTTLQNNTLLFRPDQDDMDMTYSHTIAIKNTFLHGNSQINRSVPHVPSTIKGSAADKTVSEDDMEHTKTHTMIIDELNQLALDNASINLHNITPATSVLDNVGAEVKMGPEEDTTHKVLKQRLHDKTVHQEGEMEMTNVGGRLLLSVGNPEFEALQEKTLYLGDLDDMDMTRAHTVAIENKLIGEIGHRLSQSNETLSTPSLSRSRLRDVKYNLKPHSVPDCDEKCYSYQASCDQDLDVAVSNTVVIDGQKPGNDAHLTGPKSKTLSSVSCDSQDKTLFLYEQNMDITRSHTTAIESKILEEVKAKNVTRELPNTKRKSFLDMTHNISMAGKSFQGEDMDITRSNTVFIDHISDKPRNKGNHISDGLLRESVSSRPKCIVPSGETIFPICNIEQSSIDKTICNEGDMDITRSYTVAIEGKILNGVKAKNVTAEFLDTRKSVLDRTTTVVKADDLTSRISFQGIDMDISRSNTVFIDQNSDMPHNKSTHVSDRLLKKSVLYCPKASVSSDETILQDFNIEETNANVDLTKILENKTFIDKTICNQGDMEMTRSHTVAIENKILDGARSKNVTMESFNFKRTSFLERDDLTSKISFQGEDMDITKSNTVFIDQISGLPHNKSAHVSVGLSKRKSISSRPKSLVPGDDTIILVCNMDKTNGNVHLTECLENKVSVNKTLSNEGDMEITRSHTVAIENKTFEPADIAYLAKTRSQVSTAVASYAQMATARPQAAANSGVVPPSVSKSTSYKDVSMSMERNDSTMNISVRELSKLQGNGVLAQRNKIFPLDGEETVFPNDTSMDIAEAYNANVEVNFLDHNPDIPYSSKGLATGDGGKACGELMEMSQKSEVSEPTENLETCRRKSYARSPSLSVRSGIFLDSLGIGELPRMHSSMVEEVSLLKPGPCNTETEIILDNGSKATMVGFIDPQSRENRHTSFRNSILAKSNSKRALNSGIAIDCKMESLEENGTSAEKSVCEDEVKSQLLSAKIVSLNTTSELRPVNVSLIHESNQVTLESRDIAPEETKDPVDALEMELKKAKLKGKRVSFYFPEIETPSKDEILEQGTKSFCFPEMETVAKDEMLEQEKPNDAEHQDRTVHAPEDINDFGLISQASGVCKTPDTENLEEKTIHKEHESTSKTNVLPKDISKLEGFGIPAELSERSRNKRRSIADVLLSIKGLTQKPKISPHHTAPVSSLIDQLPATSQTLCPSRSVTEQVLVSLELPNKETIHKTNPTSETRTISREHCLPSRRSVKIFVPKLPNKRASSTTNLLEKVKSSEAQPQNDQSSKVFLKTSSHDIGYGQCIDEEMLPDDQEINGIFDYEVPEGAWEELCKNEALLQNVNTQTSQPKDSMTGQKRVHNTEHDSESQSEKRGRLNEDEEQTSMAFKSTDKSYRSDNSTLRASKSIEQTCNSSGSQDSRADGMSVELTSQQCSQMDSQLPWDSRCEQSLWQRFHDGTITVQEFFVLLGIRILIQKPRYSELPSKHSVTAELTASEILLDQYVYQPKLQVYDEECHTLFQAMEELKGSTELQHKPLVQVNSLLWEALRMCSENELMCFGATLKNMKSSYSKKSKLLAHKAKVSMYSKLLRTAQIQKEKLQERLSAADELLGELDDCISSLETEPVKLDGEDGPENGASGVQGCTQADIDDLKSQQRQSIQENSELEERKEKLLAQLGSLQEEARVIGERLEEPRLTEWELVKWTDTEATFNFLYSSLEMSISFGDCIDGESFIDQPCQRVSCVTVESQLDEESAPPSTLLVHRLISQYIEKKSTFQETCTTQKDLPKLLFDLSLVVSRCKLLGEELEYLKRWGTIYNILRVHVQNQEVSLLFSSLATLCKFELIIQLSDTYPTTPLSFTLNNRIGSITTNKVTEVMSNVPVGLWYLKRTVKSLHESLLV